MKEYMGKIRQDCVVFYPLLLQSDLEMYSCIIIIIIVVIPYLTNDSSSSY